MTIVFIDCQCVEELLTNEFDLNARVYDKN